MKGRLGRVRSSDDMVVRCRWEGFSGGGWGYLRLTSPEFFCFLRAQSGRLPTQQLSTAV